MTAAEKFQDLLRQLFQFDCADLDFGIYRVMNHKREAVERFVSSGLPRAVSDELDKDALREQADAQAALDAARDLVVKTLGASAIDADGNLDAAYRQTPLGERYAAAKARAAYARSREALETDVYNHLFAFFRRYYQDGDFISKRRYSRSNRYAVPYNGEEVYLHWANSDQYYVKTDEHFRNYDWSAPANGGDVSVRFRVRAANVENGNVKGERRFFIPRAEDVEWDADARAATIPFEYRPLSAAEKRRYGTRNQQDKITAAAVREIPKRLRAASAPDDALSALESEHRLNGNGDAVSRLEHHLKRYARKNESDFFIHKDLSGFLNRELDFYIKNEVLNLDDLNNAGESAGAGWFQIMRLIKAVGGGVIDFLAQIEGFQKTLWEKRKFVTDVQYCVTVGAIDARFHAEIIANDAQWAEWRDLFGASDADRKPAFLKANPTLVVDTAHFDANFADRLLASFDDIDCMTDGVLVHGENWQALRLMEEVYKGRVKCVYIDPPYNTDMAPILYKNGYRHSSWMSLVAQGVTLAEPYMTNNGVLAVAIDDEEAYNLKKLLDQVLVSAEYAGTVVVQNNPGGRDINTHVAISHDYCVFYANPDHKEMLLPRPDGESTKEGPFRRTGGLSSPAERENSEFAFYYDPATLNILGVGGKRTASYPAIYEPTVIHCWDETGESSREISPQSFFGQYADCGTLTPQFSNGDRGVWRWSDRQRILAAIKGGDIFLRKNSRGNVAVVLRSESRPTYKPKTIWNDSRFSSTTHGTILLQDILGSKGGFSYPKSVYAVKDAVESTTYGFPNATVLDYFAGSGTTAHAVINLNREDGGSRKFVLVEMGEYFDTVLLPRVKKVIFSPEWKDGKPKRAANGEEAERGPRIVKYLRIESYEDALDGIEFDDAMGEMRLEERFGDEYTIKYMLKWETKGSRTLLNLMELTRPFAYRLRSHANGANREAAVDLAETFNWLIGMNARTRRVHDNAGRRYLIYRGETRDAPGRETVAIWRDTAGWDEADFARDEDFVSKNELADGADTLYMNGGSAIEGSKSVETLFDRRMFAGVGGERRLDGRVR